jgi:hypothetical protein
VSGRVRQLIDELVRLRARGRPGTEHFVRAHLALNGIDPTAYEAGAPDDEEAIRRLEAMIEEFHHDGEDR